MPNRKEHPQSTAIRGWLLSDPIIRALPEAGAYATYATEQDAAWQATAAASRDGARVMTLRHRGNRGRFFISQQSMVCSTLPRLTGLGSKQHWVNTPPALRPSVTSSNSASGTCLTAHWID